jgi:hypothetical protein
MVAPSGASAQRGRDEVPAAAAEFSRCLEGEQSGVMGESLEPDPQLVADTARERLLL